MTTTSTTKGLFLERAEIPAYVASMGGYVTAMDQEGEAGNIAMDMRTYFVVRLKKRVFLDQVPGGFSLVKSNLIPGTRLLRDKLNPAKGDLVLGGSMKHGNRMRGPGGAHFTPLEGAYTFGRKIAA